MDPVAGAVVIAGLRTVGKACRRTLTAMFIVDLKESDPCRVRKSRHSTVAGTRGITIARSRLCHSSIGRE